MYEVNTTVRCHTRAVISTGIFDRKYFYDAEHDLVAIDS